MPKSLWSDRANSCPDLLTFQLERSRSPSAKGCRWNAGLFSHAKKPKKEKKKIKKEQPLKLRTFSPLVRLQQSRWVSQHGCFASGF